jgi:hypothetical protein
MMQQQPGQQQQPPHNIPQQIQIPSGQQNQRYMSGGMPSPSLVQPSSMGGYPGASGPGVGYVHQEQSMTHPSCTIPQQNASSRDSCWRNQIDLPSFAKSRRSNPNAVQMPFGPPVRPVDQAPKSHHDVSIHLLSLFLDTFCSAFAWTIFTHSILLSHIFIYETQDPAQA